MSDRLYEALEAVHDETSFVTFLSALCADWEDEREKESRAASRPYAPGANGWENGTIGQYLDAAVRWAVASHNGRPSVGYEPSGNPWRRCADILYAGRIYE